MLVLAWLLVAASPAAALQLAGIFQDGMVLQAEPQPSSVFGTGAVLPGIQAVVSCEERAAVVAQGELVDDAGGWQVVLPPQTAGAVCDVEISGDEEVLVLRRVLFGDVWLCSGQSNMVFAMRQIFNSTEEIAASAQYTDIRFAVASRTYSEVEEEDLQLAVDWADSADSASLSSMSAVCYLYARRVYQELGKPIGLVDAAWGGTLIEAWSSPTALQSCAIPDYENPNPQNTNSALWNGMVAPLRQLTVRGFLWYQGEANAGHNNDEYSCTFPALIQDWRQQFSTLGQTLPEAPFGFVQLSTVKYGSAGTTYPRLRWHQTADQGVAPNPAQPEVFLAVAVDTYDEENGIHPRYKQVVAERLAVAGLNVAYGMSQFPASGPTAPQPRLVDTSQVQFEFDRPVTFDSSELTGFYSCCGGDCPTTNNINSWPEVTADLVGQKSSSSLTLNRAGLPDCEAGPLYLAYLWRQTPIETPVWGAPLYSADQFRLPSPPWIWKIE